MTPAAHVVSSFIYAAIGIVSATMAGKSFLSKRYLPFHENAAEIPWENLAPGVQFVVLALMRTSGLGFLVVASLLIPLPFLTCCTDSLYLTLVVPFISLLFCVGLFVVNLQLSERTGVRTPWKGALYAALAIVISICVSVVSG